MLNVAKLSSTQARGNMDPFNIATFLAKAKKSHRLRTSAELRAKKQFLPIEKLFWRVFAEEHVTIIGLNQRQSTLDCRYLTLLIM
jgi:hypothetical protein